MSTTDDEVVGRRGTVSVRIRGGDRPGEITVAIRGGTETFIAYCDVEVARHDTVLVYRDRGGRSVDVTPFPEGGPVVSCT